MHALLQVLQIFALNFNKIFVKWDIAEDYQLVVKFLRHHKQSWRVFGFVILFLLVKLAQSDGAFFEDVHCFAAERHDLTVLAGDSHPYLSPLDEEGHERKYVPRVVEGLVADNHFGCFRVELHLALRLGGLGKALFKDRDPWVPSRLRE